jgi:hypothetical protein
MLKTQPKITQAIKIVNFVAFQLRDGLISALSKHIGEKLTPELIALCAGISVTRMWQVIKGYKEKL